MFNNIENIIERIELEYVEYVEKRMDERKKLLPLSGPEQIRGLIWNLLSDPRWRSEISYNDYNRILDIWLKRIS